MVSADFPFCDIKPRIVTMKWLLSYRDEKVLGLNSWHKSRFEADNDQALN